MFAAVATHSVLPLHATSCRRDDDPITDGHTDSTHQRCSDINGDVFYISGTANTTLGPSSDLGDDTVTTFRYLTL